MLTLLKRQYWDVSVIRTRELINNDFHTEAFSKLSAYIPKAVAAIVSELFRRPQPVTLAIRTRPIRSESLLANCKVFGLVRNAVISFSQRVWPKQKRGHMHRPNCTLSRNEEQLGISPVVAMHV